MSAADFYRIVIIEDNTELREAYEMIIRSSEDFFVVNAYSNCEEAIKRIEKDDPNIVMIDLSLPGITGIEGASRIKKLKPDVKVLVVTVHDDEEHVFNALCAGAIGYITKDFNHIELINLLNQVVSGGAPMSPKIANIIIRSFHKNPITPLTDRETEVIKQLAIGKTYDDISIELQISRDTVKTHIKHIYEKLHVNSKSEALRIARKDKLV